MRRQLLEPDPEGEIHEQRELTWRAAPADLAVEHRSGGLPRMTAGLPKLTPAMEPHFTIQQLAALWNLDGKTVASWFRAQPGVLKIGEGERQTLRIPRLEDHAQALCLERLDELTIDAVRAFVSTWRVAASTHRVELERLRTSSDSA